MCDVTKLVKTRFARLSHPHVAESTAKNDGCDGVTFLLKTSVSPAVGAARRAEGLGGGRAIPPTLSPLWF